MSSTTGTLYSLKGEPQGYFAVMTECNYSNVCESAEALWDNFTDGEGWDKLEYLDCICENDNAHQACWLYDEFFGYMPGRWCPTCHAILEGNRGFGDFSCSDRMCQKYGCKHWPKKGKPPADLGVCPACVSRDCEHFCVECGYRDCSLSPDCSHRNDPEPD